MSLWGKIDAANNAPKFLLNSADFPAANTAVDYGGLPMQVDINNAYLVDTTEAGASANRLNGIKTPGWILYKEYGTGRKYVETLVSMRVAASVAGDLGISGNTEIEDATVSDGFITITTQPANASVTAPAVALFSVVAASDPFAALSYQWQKAESTNTASWASITGATASTLSVISANTINASNTELGSNGDVYRVTISGDGFVSVTSSNATLTVA
jgi:hypothetical protein